jgi:hypothetical protein
LKCTNLTDAINARQIGEFSILEININCDNQKSIKLIKTTSLLPISLTIFIASCDKTRSYRDAAERTALIWHDNSLNALRQLEKEYPDYKKRLNEGYDTRLEMFVREVHVSIDTYIKNASEAGIAPDSKLRNFRETVIVNPRNLKK